MFKIFILLNAFLLIKFAITDEEQEVHGPPDVHYADSEKIEELASRAVDQINQETNNTFLFFPVKVLCAKSSRVAGINFELRVLVGQSNCAKNQPKAKHTNCTTETDLTARKVYEVSVLQQSSKNLELIKFKQEKVGNATEC